MNKIRSNNIQTKYPYNFELFFIDHKIMRSHSQSCSHTHTECPTAPKVPEMHFYFMQNNAEVGCTMVHMATQISISAMFMVYSLLGKSSWLRPCMQVFTDTQVRVGRPLNSICTAQINCLSQGPSKIGPQACLSQGPSKIGPQAQMRSGPRSDLDHR